MDTNEHKPVLLNEVVELLRPSRKSKIVDATLGFGGHTAAFLEKNASVLAIEIDPEVAKLAKKRLYRYLEDCPGSSLKVVNGNFSCIEEIVKKEKFCPVSGILFDLGVSQWHFRKSNRGFSFKDECLDMRLTKVFPTTAFDIINDYPAKDLAEIFSRFSQEKNADPISRKIVDQRRMKNIQSARQLSSLIESFSEVPGTKRHGDYHQNPATKVFLALRIVVNHELENLEQGLAKALNIISPGGRVAVISFHSGEDRVVKLIYKKMVRTGKFCLVNKKPIFPSKKEIINNISARSAVLRAIERNG